MKKLILVCPLMAVVFAAISTNANACDGVVYSRPSRIVCSSPVVYSQPVVHATVHTQPAVVATTVVRYATQAPKAVAPVEEKRDVEQVVEKLPEIVQGSVVRARVRFAGRDTGEVTVVSGSLEMQCEILEWSASMVTFRMPQIEIVSDASIQVKVFSASGNVVKSVIALLTPPVDFSIEPPATTLTHNETEVSGR